MKRVVVAIAFAALGAAACWPTKPNKFACSQNPALCDGGTPDGDGGGKGDMKTEKCTDSSTCTSASAPVCDTASGACVPCSATEACASDKVCDTSGGAMNGQCVTCTTADDSACNGQVCVNDACVPCTAHSQCKTNICDIDAGTCAAATDIIYVDNSNTSCVDTKHTSTAAAPYCQITAALGDVTTTAKYVSVAGSTTAYNAVAWTGSTALAVQLVGPGKSAAPTAYIDQIMKPAVYISPTGGTAKFVFDGFEMTGAAGQPGANCSAGTGTAALTLRDSYIHESGANGVNANACTLTLTRSIVYKNAGAITVSGGGTYDMENNFIVGNLTPPSSAKSAAISLPNAGSGTFVFNTVVGNTSSDGYPTGVDCGPAGPQNIDASIVVGNMGTSTQFSAGCTIGAKTIIDTSSMQPTFVMSSATDYHLSTVAGDNACCIDQVDPSTTGLPKLDIDGSARPKGSADDIGAHEAK